MQPVLMKFYNAGYVGDHPERKCCGNVITKSWKQYMPFGGSETREGRGVG